VKFPNYFKSTSSLIINYLKIATFLNKVSEKVVKYPAEKSAGYKGLNPKCHAAIFSLL
jgi:hypothetical protein